ncbi:hypothetical protein L1987_77001 [Smallanthus sonchifolius]|uniref:Uncharacterized protein n=1 Tax=Smallanthus sonchifolius TaxID=185202 RepID=A0ACB8Z8Z3_9ASTR|nr:hypothetical protein L1987_77001 [Smallanthus sonchifolius]
MRPIFRMILKVKIECKFWWDGKERNGKVDAEGEVASEVGWRGLRLRDERKYPNRSRPNKAAGTGYWKATEADKPIGKPKSVYRLQSTPADSAPGGTVLKEGKSNQSSATSSSSEHSC